MKVLYIASTASIIYTIKFQEPIKSTYDKAQDTFLHWKFAVAPCAVVALLTHLLGSGTRNFDLMELLWTFSIYLEAISILPQLIVLQRYGEVENLTGNYIFFMGAYRFLYILNWIYRAYTEKGYQHHYVVYLCGVLQTLLYVDFFYYYFKRYVISLLPSGPNCFENALVWTNICVTVPKSHYDSKKKGGKFKLPTTGGK